MSPHLKPVVLKLATSFLRKYRGLDAAINRKRGPILTALNSVWLAVLIILLVTLAQFGFWPGYLAKQDDYSIRFLRETIVLDGAYAIKKADERLATCKAEAKSRLLPARLLLAAEATFVLEANQEANREPGTTPPKLTKPQSHLLYRALSMGNPDTLGFKNIRLHYDTAFEQANQLVRGLCTPAQNWVGYVYAITTGGEPEETAAANHHIAKEDRLEAIWYSYSDAPVYLSYLASLLAAMLAFFALEVYRARRESMLPIRAVTSDSPSAK